MDFFKSCLTGVYSLEDFSNIDYWSASVASNRNGSQVEHFYRSQNILTRWNEKSALLWVFASPEGTNAFARATVDLSIPHNLSLTTPLEFTKGLFKSGDLASLSREPRFDPIKPRQAPGEQCNFSVHEVYANLIFAIQLHISFRLAKEAFCIPISACCFALLEPGFKTGYLENSTLPIANIDCRLTSSGSLTISFSPCNASSIVPLGHSRQADPLLYVSNVILSPISIPATVVGPVEGGSSDATHEWQEMVTEFLFARGINVSGLDQSHQWINVRLPKTIDAGHFSNIALGGHMVSWPIRLCFSKHNISHSTSASTPIPLLNDKEDSPPGEFGTLESALSIRSAEKWILNQPERDRQLKARIQSSQEIFTAQKYVSVSSPMSTRGIIFGELHGIPGVYPTPPDVLSQNIFSSAPDNAMSVPAETPSMYGVGDVDMKDSIGSDAEQFMGIPVTSDHKSLESNLGFDDGLFDDMDDEDFPGQTITDADFNFFDDPGEEIIKETPIESGELEGFSDLAIDSVEPDSSVKPIGNTPGAAQQDDEQAVSGAEDNSKLGLDTSTRYPHQQDENTRLSPMEVRKRLTFEESPCSHRSPGKCEVHQRKSAFEPLPFHHDLRDADAKYSEAGQFGVSQPVDKKRSATSDISLSPKKPRFMVIFGSSKTSNTNQLFSDESDGSSLRDGSVSGSEDAHNNTSITKDSESFIGSPLTDDANATELPALNVVHGMLEQLFQYGDFESVVSGAHFGADGSPTLDVDFISVAQLVTMQVLFDDQASVRLSAQGREQLLRDRALASSALDGFQIKTKTIFGLKEVNSLVQYAAISDMPLESQTKSIQRPGTPKPNQAHRPEPAVSGHLFKLPSSLIRVRRNDALWDVLPPAANFWNTLGLAPTCGPKNIITYAVFPANDGMEDATLEFIKDLSICYESCRLGNHTRGKPVFGNRDCLIPWHLSSDKSPDLFESSLDAICTDLGYTISRSETARRKTDFTQPSNPDCFVVYIINPDDHPSSLAKIASGFWTLLDAYYKVEPSQTLLDIVLQVVPRSVVSGDSGVVLLRNDRLQNLAREVYDRCPSFSHPNDMLDLPICSHSSIRLSDGLPRKIPFEMVAEPPMNIMLDNSQLHVAYTTSMSGNWITAAFSDNTGRNQTVLSYCLSGNRAFVDVATEIWQTCIEIMLVRRVNWRLCISRVGLMPTEELEAWTTLASPQQRMPLIVVLISVETAPSRVVKSPPNLQSPNILHSTKANGQTQTPAHYQGVSPDSVNTPVTPSDSTSVDPSTDPDAFLSDITDETWGIILSHRPVLSPGPDDYQISMSSALLMKLPPQSPTTNPFNAVEQVSSTKVNCVAVHLHWARHSGKGADPLTGASSMSALPKTSTDTILREYLGMFRNLALLAKVRGIGDWMAGLIPWHILAATRAAEGLDRVYGSRRWADR